ncbi:brachyurin-like [Zophobas morio]|uniref:brachyurin-like n=1 Tax=Zophobas morio TaxID=2755281 RepID=UPI0030837815
MKLVVILTTVVLVSAVPKPSRLGFRNIYKNPIKTLHPDVKTPRIIGGHEVTPHSIPYSAFLELYSGNDGWYCGGSLISENYVVTSAHCTYSTQSPVEATIILGAHRPFDLEDSQVELVSTEITIHENYDNEEIVNDIAVIKLPTPVEFNNYIDPIALPSFSDADNDYENALVTASGWGLTDGHGTTVSEVLNFVQLTVISNLDCQTYFGTLESSILCTSGLQNSGVCNGDGGGPLVTDQVLIGIVSFTVPYCLDGYPSAFTRVTSFLDWLGENTDVIIE